MILSLLLPFLAFSAPVVGVGLGLEEKDHQVLVHEVIANTPAARNGAIHAGDRILAVHPSPGDTLGWLSVRDLNVDEVVQLVRGEAGEKVELRLEGAGGKYQVQLPRESFEAP